jgi:hypothetical protein
LCLDVTFEVLPSVGVVRLRTTHGVSFVADDLPSPLPALRTGCGVRTHNPVEEECRNVGFVRPMALFADNPQLCSPRQAVKGVALFLLCLSYVETVSVV